MTIIKQEKILNKLKVIKTDLTDSKDGTVTFETNTGRQFSAFFWGHEFKINKTYFISFTSLEHDLKWERIFSENKDKKKIVETENKNCSYLAYGQIISINPVAVDLGEFVMDIGEWTNDNRVIGEYIYWKIDRLDVLDAMICA